METEDVIIGEGQGIGKYLNIVAKKKGVWGISAEQDFSRYMAITWAKDEKTKWDVQNAIG